MVLLAKKLGKVYEHPLVLGLGSEPKNGSQFQKPLQKSLGAPPIIVIVYNNTRPRVKGYLYYVIICITTYNILARARIQNVQCTMYVCTMYNDNEYEYWCKYKYKYNCKLVRGSSKQLKQHSTTQQVGPDHKKMIFFWLLKKGANF